jgi:uncharacterized protein YprB with RNaseH-like and TPR domain
MVVREFPLSRIGKELRDRVEKAKKSEMKENSINNHTYFFRGVEHHEYKKAQELKQTLLKNYRGKPLEEVIEGEECITDAGTCYKIETHTTLTVKLVSPEYARERILGNLKLMYGIGEATERVLKTEGYRSIEDLRDHPQFGSEAAQFLELDMGDIYSLIEWIGHWLPLSHPLVLYSSSFHNKEDFVILDIETMGLFSLPIIVCGVAQINGSHLLMTQYLLRTINEEAAALSGLLSHTPGNILVTFNGKAFDIPYIRERLTYYRLKGTLENPHFDLLHFSRRAWKDKVPDCRLNTLEEHLFGIKRNNDVPSALVPDFYDTYMKTGNIGPLIPIIEHNRQDMITLANIFSRLHEEWK